MVASIELAAAHIFRRAAAGLIVPTRLTGLTVLLIEPRLMLLRLRIRPGHRHLLIVAKGY
ncbi:hypothetical protein ACFSKM_04455 [Ancylobacter dichloromethanicus]